MHHFLTKGQWPTRTQTICKIWLPNSTKLPTKLFGSGLMIKNIQEQHYSCQKNFAKWHFAKHTTINLEATIQLLKLISSKNPLTTGHRSTLTSSNTPKRVSDANNVSLQWTNLCLFICFPHRTNQICASLQTFLDQCWLQAVSINAFSALLMMPSPNTHLLRLLKIRMQKLWLKPFFLNGFANLASQQLILTAGRSLLIRLSKELFDLLNVEHTKMTLAHPQCNAQVEVFNKTIKKYLASIVDATTLDRENFLPALMLSYNSSYHSTITMTTFELLFGTKPRLPSFPNPDIQRVLDGESTLAERYQLLQKNLLPG
jgi:hypothetical protein